MKAWILAGALLLAGCDEAYVLSPEGDKELAFCSTDWMKCVEKACPSGYIVVTSSIIKCNALQVLRCP